MLRENPSRIKWQLLLVGLFFIIKQSEARAVNVSNTWTMPQEGLNVFYRFFRDRISWFEADAVCQFHHANLVTVDNSFQFDATRDLLRELDVNDIVWIGLMRPQSSDRFMWSNSRPLVADTGYWAESLPLMDAPLCAVIDPIRDYRWHALRCGGPETASFLCEMPVPGWADACNLKDMPNLTLQYMADTASIELIRNCQEEGLLRAMCRGKQDRERALQDLVCPRERLEAQRINDITNSHFKSLQIINSIPSDNNENNDIELLPMDVNYGSHFPEELQTEKNTVQRLIEQFNVDELMQADEPSNMETVSSFYKIPGLIPKPVKKSAKKALGSPKKDILKQKSNGMVRLSKEQKRLPVEMDEMMMGDQPIQGEQEMLEPFLNEEVSNEILEPLPHIKKTNIHREDSLEKLESMKKSIQNPKEKEDKKLLTMNVPALAATVTTISNTPIILSTSTAEMTSTTTTSDKKDKMLKVTVDNTYHTTHTVLDNNSDHLVTTTSSAAIGHPIHPQKPRGSGISEESEHPRTKEATDNSHFIPPMLMVKSHYVPPANKHGHDHQQHHQQHQQQLKHEEKQLNLQATTSKPENIRTSEKVPIQKTTLKALDTSLSSTEEVKGIAFNNHGEHKVALIPKTEADSTIKPTTEQPATEIKLTQNSQNLYNEEVETTTTAKPLHSVASTSKFTKNTENSQEINKNYANGEKDTNGKEVLSTPQTSHTDSESIQAATSAATAESSSKSPQILYDSPTMESITEKEIADATTIKVMTPTQQQKVLSIEEKQKTIRNEKHKQVLPTTNSTPGKLAVPQSAEVLTTSTTVSQSVTQQTPTSKQTETVKLILSLQQIEKELTNAENPKEANKNKTIVKTKEMLQTSTTVGKEQQDGEESEERVTEEGAVTISVPLLATTKSGSLSASTTVKSITTTVPQNEVKSTAASFSSAGTTISATSPSTTTPTKTTTAGENNKYTTTTTASTSKRFATSTITAIVTTTADEVATEAATAAATSATATARPETSTQKPSVDETTRNFLKVTTEMPFKPNRRRTLTKPETVSYMKKILG